jgi:hypothetical protein
VSSMELRPARNISHTQMREARGKQRRRHLGYIPALWNWLRRSIISLNVRYIT